MRFESGHALLLCVLFGASTAAAEPPDTVLLNGYEHCGAPQLMCPDGDGDDYGNTPYCINACEKPYDFLLVPAGDCNDDDAAINPDANELCDYVDNDCNNGIDEDFPTLGSSCSTALPGQCQAGTVVCTGNGAGIRCNQNIAASAEVCDGQDNDCDAQVDEGNPGAGDYCSTGQQGVCEEGITVCSGVMGVTCQRSQGPSPECFDGLDNDCDGLVDENFPPVCP